MTMEQDHETQERVLDLKHLSVDGGATWMTEDAKAAYSILNAATGMTLSAVLAKLAAPDVPAPSDGGCVYLNNLCSECASPETCKNRDAGPAPSEPVVKLAIKMLFFGRALATGGKNG
jgi:hypothetical protein